MAGENRKAVESHGCIVCGRVHELLVVYAPDGRMIDCSVTSPGGRRVYDADRPLAACDTHSDSRIQAAYDRRRSTAGPEEDEEP